MATMLVKEIIRTYVCVSRNAGREAVTLRSIISWSSITLRVDSHM